MSADLPCIPRSTKKRKTKPPRKPECIPAGSTQMLLTSRSGYCFVPFCPSSYLIIDQGKGRKIKFDLRKHPRKGDELKEEHHVMFPVPHIQENFEAWKKNIPKRNNKELTKRDKICASHFRKEDIIDLSYQAICDSGDRVELSEKTYKYLKPGAVPVFFDAPGMPKYLANRNKFKRKPPRERPLPCKVQKKLENSSVVLVTNTEDDPIVYKEEEVEEEESEPRDVVTPSNSPIIFEPYTPMYKETDTDIIFTDHSYFSNQLIGNDIQLNSTLANSSVILVEAEQQSRQATVLLVMDCESETKGQKDATIVSNLNSAQTSTEIHKKPSTTMPQGSISVTPQTTSQLPDELLVNLPISSSKNQPCSSKDDEATIYVASNNTLVTSSMCSSTCSDSPPPPSPNPSPSQSPEPEKQSLPIETSFEPIAKETSTVNASVPRLVPPKPSVSSTQVIRTGGVKQYHNNKAMGIVEHVQTLASENENIEVKKRLLLCSEDDPTGAHGKKEQYHNNKAMDIVKHVQTPATENENIKVKKRLGLCTEDDSSRAHGKKQRPPVTEKSITIKIVDLTTEKSVKPIPSKPSLDPPLSQNIIDKLSKINKPKIIVDKTLVTQVTYNDFIKVCSKVKLPSSQWALQTDPSSKFISYSFIDVNPSGSLSEKRIIFQGSMTPKVWFDGIFKNSLYAGEMKTPFEVYSLLMKLHDMTSCPGTNHPAQPFSCNCRVYKYSGAARCIPCHQRSKALHERDLARLKKQDKSKKVMNPAAEKAIDIANKMLSAVIVSNVENDDYAGRTLEDAIEAAGNSELLAQEEELFASIADMLE